MKKSFPLEVPSLKPPRVIEAVKSDVRKYIRRERRKKLPEGVDFCDFACRIGPDRDTTAEAHVAELNSRIVTGLQERHGWDAMADRIPIRCFQSNPSIKSSLTFLRKTP